MARKRDIDPSLWDHEELNALPVQARYLFIGVISNADDEGRLKGAPRYLKRLVFSYDEDITVEQVREWRDQLVAQKHLCRYEIGLDLYVHLPSWHRWQSINRLMVSKIPPCPEHGACPKHEAVFADDVSGPDALTEEYVSVHAPLRERETTTGPVPEPAPEPDRTGAGTGPEPGRAASAADAQPDRAAEPPPTARKRALPKEAPPPPQFATFHGYLEGMKGYAPTEAFWAAVAKNYATLDLDLEAAKILDFLRRHPDRNCNVPFLTRWLNGALADRKGTAANGGLARLRLGGAPDADKPGRFHRTCGTIHQGWEPCPADAGMPRVNHVGPGKRAVARPAREAV